MAKQKSHAEFLNDVIRLVKDEYKTMGTYKNARTEIKMKHIVCNFEWEVKPHDFLNGGSRCPKCNGGVRKKSTEYFKQEVFEKVGEEYEVLGEYKGSQTKIKMKHILCSNEYEVKAIGFLRGSRCPKCNWMNKDTESYKREIYNLVGNEYEVLGEYVLANTKIRMKHNNESCNNFEFDMKPNVFLSQGSRCLKCAGVARRDTEIFKSQVFELVQNEFTVLGEYKNSLTKIKIKHNNESCGNHEYEVTPNSFLHYESRCPKCNESKGEKAISKFLTHNNIDHETQYKFDDCRNKKVLPFDFAIMENNELVMLIEYDGEFHYIETKINSKTKLKYNQKNDKIKTKYCKQNDIKLLRIPYWEFDKIETIISNELSDLCHTLNVK